MAKTNWGMNDTIMPDDMNQIGQEINNATNRLDDKVDKVSGKGLSTNDYTAAEKTKLAGIATGAQVNPGAATTSAAGLMSAADKTKLDGVANGANAYVHPSGDGNQHIPATGTGSNGKVLKSGATAGSAAWSTLTKSDISDFPISLPANGGNSDTVDGFHVNDLITPFASTYGGSSTNLKADFTPAFTKVTGRAVRIRSAYTTVGSPTLDADGTGATPIRNPNGSPAKLKEWGVYTLVYDASNAAFILQGEGGEYGTAVAADVLVGKTIGTEKGLVTGTMPHFKGHNEAAYVEPNPGGTRLFMMPHVGYYDAGANNTWVYRDDPNFSAANIVKGKSIFGVAGSAQEAYSASIMSPNGSTSVVYNIPTTKTVLIAITYSDSSFIYYHIFSAPTVNTGEIAMRSYRTRVNRITDVVSMQSITAPTLSGTQLTVYDIPSELIFVAFKIHVYG